MKRLKIWMLLLTVMTVLATVAGLCACDLGGTSSDPTYTLSLTQEGTIVLEVGDEVDYTQYFSIKDKNGNALLVTENMLDLRYADTSAPCTFTVTLTFDGQKISAKFQVVAKGENPDPDPNPDPNPDPDKPDDPDNPGGTVTPEKEGFNPITSPVAGDYLMGMDVEGTMYYLKGGMNGYYLATSADVAEAKPVTLKETTGGWLLLCDGQYIEIELSGEHVNAVYKASQTSGKVWVWQEEHGLFTMTVSGTEYYLGTYWKTGYTNPYNTIGGSEYSGYSEDRQYHAVLGTYKEGSGTGGNTGSDETADKALQDALKGYDNRSSWNFVVTKTETYEGESFDDYYEYLGYNVLNSYEDTNGDSYTDYLGYDTASGTYSFYYDNGDGTYEIFAENTDDFDESYSYLYLVDIAELKNIKFTYAGGKYSAQNAASAATAVLGEYSYTDEYGYLYTENWTSFDLYLANGRISKIVAETDGDTTVEYAFSGYGSVNFTLPDGSSGGGTDTPVTPSGTMEKQTYNASTFDHQDMQEKYLGYDEAVGLPSTGTYNALVIPVQFTDELFAADELQKLNLVFNGTPEQTGWESVQSYYKKSSYHQLNITFDICSTPFTTKYALSYYENRYNNYMDAYYNGTLNDNTPASGEEVILLEALRWLDSNGMDFSKYDTNQDGCIDAVYLIYSADIDYDTEGAFRWAYCTWYIGSEQFDGIDAYYYFFASVDFMLEKTPQGNPAYETIPGMILNAETYIHESGHLLGLDDYYDYYADQGSDQGLGGADMMDYNIGDHDVYSKIMLGWMEPTIVNETKTVTLTPSVSSASAILIPLNFDNSYFCEYLLIDLYSNTELNAIHSSDLYDGKQYGVRIYHVSSSMSYDSDYQYHYFTYNNSDTKYALIKLVEADGGNSKFTATDGLATQNDLWKTGQKLSSVFPSYTRNDGKKLNFDIEIGAVSATEATVTITFNA